MITLQFETKNLANTELLLREFPDMAPRFLAEAVNAALPVIGKSLVAAVVRDNVLDESAAVKTISFRKANAGNMMAIITSSGYVPSLMRYDTSPRVPSYRAEVMARVKRSHGAVAFPHAFIASMRSGNVHVTSRIPGTSTRYTTKSGRTRIGEKLKVLMGPSVASLFGTSWDKDSSGKLLDGGEDVIRREVDKALEFLRAT